MNFDMPNSFAAVCRRDRSNTPLQALNLLNDPVFYEAAQALAVRTLREAEPGFAARLDRAFLLSLGRKPSPREQERLLGYYTAEQHLLDRQATAAAFPFEIPGLEAQDGAAWVGVSRVLLNLDQFITRE
jgi:hypothetical protein